MYRLNKQNPIAKKLMELDDAISEYLPRSAASLRRDLCRRIYRKLLRRAGN